MKNVRLENTKSAASGAMIVPLVLFHLLEVTLAPNAREVSLLLCKAAACATHARVEHMPKRAVPSALCVLQAQFQAAGVGTVATALPAILPKTQWHVKPVEVELSPWEEAVATVLQAMSRALQAQFARAAIVF